MARLMDRPLARRAALTSVAALAASGVLAGQALAPPTGVVIQRIVVTGNERIERSTIVSYLPIQVGGVADAASIDLALKTLFRTDLFADVDITVQGNDLVVRVAENPIINQVVF